MNKKGTDCKGCDDDDEDGSFEEPTTPAEPPIKQGYSSVTNFNNNNRNAAADFSLNMLNNENAFYHHHFQQQNQTLQLQSVNLSNQLAPLQELPMQQYHQLNDSNQYQQYHYLNQQQQHQQIIQQQTISSNILNTLNSPSLTAVPLNELKVGTIQQQIEQKQFTETSNLSDFIKQQSHTPVQFVQSKSSSSVITSPIRQQFDNQVKDTSPSSSSLSPSPPSYSNKRTRFQIVSTNGDNEPSKTSTLPLKIF